MRVRGCCIRDYSIRRVTALVRSRLLSTHSPSFPVVHSSTGLKVFQHLHILNTIVKGPQWTPEAQAWNMVLPTPELSTSGLQCVEVVNDTLRLEFSHPSDLYAEFAALFFAERSEKVESIAGHTCSTAVLPDWALPVDIINRSSIGAGLTVVLSRSLVAKYLMNRKDANFLQSFSSSVISQHARLSKPDH